MLKPETNRCVTDIIATSASHPASQTLNIQQSEPLWKRVPTRDANGQLYHDFMMLIPGLRNFESARIQAIVNKIEQALKCYEKAVVLADLNMKLNVLWVTIQPSPGLIAEIAALIHHVVPEAKLVAQHRS